MPQTMFDKIWEAHEVADGLIYIDLHLVHEVTSPQAFDGLRLEGRKVRRPDKTVATADHNVPTDGTAAARLIADELSRVQVETLERNCEEFGIPIYSIGSERQGIVHVIGPGARAHPAGADDRLRRQPHLDARRVRGARVRDRHLRGRARARHPVPRPAAAADDAHHLLGRARHGVTAKDMILATIGRLGVGGMVGHAVEYAGEAIRGLTMENRMTICNMTIEGGGRAGMIAPDETTFEWVEGRPGAPNDFEAAVERWRALPTEEGAAFDTEVEVDAGSLSPMVTWGTNPGQVVEVTGEVPEPALGARAARPALHGPGARARRSRRSSSIGCSSAPAPTRGSATCARRRRSSRAARWRARVDAMVVPGSAQVKAEAEAEGLDEIFRAAGFDWRSAGCSMCLGMNPDILSPGERCASTSNRNFEGRQGKGGRTHLVSPEDGGRGRDRGPFRRHPRVELNMEAVEVIEGRVSVLDREDVDTDQIIPKQFLKRVERTGFGEFLFYDWIRDGEIELEPNPILVTGRNFGCGSSREHAPWALQDFGFDAIIAPSFADIFYGNCTKNGLLPVILDEADCRAIAEAGAARIDLDDQTVDSAAGVVRFEIDEQVKHRLFHGLDDIAVTLQNAEAIDAFEATGRADRGPVTTAL